MGVIKLVKDFLQGRCGKINYGEIEGVNVQSLRRGSFSNLHWGKYGQTIAT